MSKQRILAVFGTRPEAIKFFPVVRALSGCPDIELKLCVTGQHRDMLDQVLALTEMKPDFDLDIMTADQTLTSVTTAVLERMSSVLDEARPDRVLVQGDTTTAMAAALAAFYRRIPVGHVEAGLRSGNIHAPWPEEVNRRIVGTVTDLHFAPTTAARDNLLKENFDPATVHVTGNTVIDALHHFSARLRTDAMLRERAQADLPTIDTTRRLILVTGHRRENFDGGMERVCQALRTLAGRGDVQIIYPVHPNPNVRRPVEQLLANEEAIHLIAPLGYLPFIYLMDRSYLILTDSGGVQEEAPGLGKPVLVMRETTERPEGVAAGTAKLVGTDSDLIIAEATRLLDDANAYARMSQARNPYGDGQASQRILEALLNV